MRKTLVLMCLAAGMLSCAKESLVPAEENTEPAGVPVSFNISIAETKADKTAWADGDVVYVFFKGLGNEGLELTRTDGVWTETPVGEIYNVDFSSLSEHVLTAVHFPVPVTVGQELSPRFKFTFSGSDGNPVYNYYLSDAERAYTYDAASNTVTAFLTMQKPADMIQIHIPGIQQNVADYTLGCYLIRPVALTGLDIDAFTLLEDVFQPGARLSGIADADGAVFAGRLVSPGTPADYTFMLADDNYSYTLKRSNKTLEAGIRYDFPTLTGGGWVEAVSGDLYVDLGLSVKWAKCNLGAGSETDFGDYFAWGELQPYYLEGYAQETPMDPSHWRPGKTGYNWDNYLWGDGSTFTKYTGSDYSVLKPEDDAAYAALGGKSRMPTRAEFDELLALSKEWVTNYNESGIAGYKFTGNGNTLLFPDAGDRSGVKLYAAISWSNYWSSTLQTSSPDCARNLHFTSTGANTNYINNRYFGYPIRPVSD